MENYLLDFSELIGGALQQSHCAVRCLQSLIATIVECAAIFVEQNATKQTKQCHKVAIAFDSSQLQQRRCLQITQKIIITILQ